MNLLNLDMNSDKEFVYCGKGVLECIKEEDSFKNINKSYTEEDFINLFKEIRDAVPEPKKELIVICNGFTDEQINQFISNFKKN